MSEKAWPDKSKRVLFWLGVYAAIIFCGMAFVVAVSYFSQRRADVEAERAATAGLPEGDEQGEPPAAQGSGENPLIKPGTDLTLGEYTFRPHLALDGRIIAFDLIKGKKKLYSETLATDGDFAEFAIVSSMPPQRSTDKEAWTVPPVAADITGDGVPEIAVQKFTGGAHCCFLLSLFSLGKSLKKIAELNGQNSPIKIEDVDGDGRPELTGRDWTFAYWRTSFADSPAPQVIWRYENGRYRLALDLMKQPPLPTPEREPVSQEPKGGRASGQQAALSPADLGYMLDLVYSGNGEAAWQFLDNRFPGGGRLTIDGQPMEKRTFRQELKQQLSRSPYWREIKQLNNWR